MYMFHGGTNFGFNNGANYDLPYIQSTVTSYDYDSPINESGDPTMKCKLFKSVIAKYIQVPKTPIPAPSAKGKYGLVQLTEYAPLFDASNLILLSGGAKKRVTPEPMENFGQSYGFILYRSKLPGPLHQRTVNVQEANDRAMIFLDGEYKGVINRTTANTQDIKIDVPGSGAQLDVLVENLGRINFGSYMGTGDQKGITFGLRIDWQFVYNWNIYNLPMNYSDLEGLYYSSNLGNAPGFYRGTLDIQSKPLDTFLSFPGWVKGVCWINGFNLGKYWNIGPQMTLYVPAPVLKRGANEIIIFELHGYSEPYVEFLPYSILG